MRFPFPEKAASAIEAEQVRLLYHQGFAIQLLGVVTAAVSVAMLWRVADHLLLALWLVAMFTLSAIRLLDNRRFERSAPEKADIRRWARRYIAGTFVSGIVWGSLALFYDPAWPAPYQVLLFVIYTGLIGGAFNTNSSLFIAFPAFYLPLVGSLMYVMLREQHEGFYTLALLFAVYIALMHVSSLKFNRRLTHALKLRFENEKLAMELARSNAKLMQLADMDPLTALYNRRSMDRFFHNEWKRHCRNRRPLSLLFVDIDFFKQYNDTYGHHEGDHCLVRIAEALKRHVRRSSDIAARFGGEEFALILPETPNADALLIAETLRRDVEALGIIHEGSACSECVTLSVGVATRVPRDPERPDTLRLDADKALYGAKEQGRNRVVNTQARTAAAQSFST